MKILVTGHAGFIGAHLCRRLLADGHEVIGRDLMADSPGLRMLGVKVPVVESSDPWPDADGVVHLAGQSHIGLGHGRPHFTWEANVKLTWECLEAYRGRRARIILAGSNHCRVRDVYGTSKEMVALLAECYWHSWNLPVTALVHVNAYGPGDPHTSHLITGAILRCLEGKGPVLRSDGSPRKGYLFIGDVVEAYRLCLVNNALPPRVVAAAPPRSAIEIARLVTQIAGIAAEPEVLGHDVSQSGYEEVWETSPELRSIGWQPMDLDEGLRRTWEWYRAHGPRWSTE